MAKRYNIRWNESDEKELKRVVKNFNQKIDRLSKKNPQNKKYLPEKVSIKEMRSLIETRQDFNRELKSLQRFSRKGSEEIVDVPDNDYNLKTTKWQKKEMQIRVATVNANRKRRKEQIESWEMKSGGKSLGYTKGDFGMGQVDEVALRPAKAFTPSMSKAELDKKFRSLRKESQTNYFDAKEMRLKKNYVEKGLLANYNEEDIKDIIEKIDEMDFDEFYKVFQEEGGTMEFAYPDSEKYQEYVEHLRATWNPQK